MKSLQKLGVLAVLFVVAFTPFGARATTVSPNLMNGLKTGISLNDKGELRVVGANVTSQTNTTVNAQIEFGNADLDFTIRTDSETKFNGRTTSRPDLDDLDAGDTVSFSGKITSSDNDSLVVAADQVVSTAFNLPTVKVLTGTIDDLDDDSFTLDVGNKDVEVKTNSSTKITINGVAKTFADLDEDDAVRVEGTVNADVTVITATKISVTDEDRNDDHSNDHESKGKKNGWFWGLGNIFKRK